MQEVDGWYPSLAHHSQERRPNRNAMTMAGPDDDLKTSAEPHLAFAICVVALGPAGVIPTSGKCSDD